MPGVLLALLLALTLVPVGCGEDDKDSTPAACEAGDRECTNDGLRTCGRDGTWGDPDPCPDTEICHPMGGGQDHCMIPGAMDMGGEGEGEGEGHTGG